MPNDHLARALLRLYPRGWRQRYGDEFLALIADAGLTWREVVDVIAAASVERVRVAIAFVRAELDPTDPRPVDTDESLSDGFLETILFAALASLTIGALALVGVPAPRWTTWLLFVFQPRVFVPTTQPLANWRERAVLSYLWFAGLALATGLLWIVGQATSWLGLPLASDRVFVSTLALFFLALLVRGIYCCVRMLTYGSTWLGVHSREFLAWRLGMLVIAAVLFSVDPAGETFWAGAMLVGLSLRTPYDLTRRGTARRRAQHEEAERFWAK